jgi:hypothetical protein
MSPQGYRAVPRSYSPAMVCRDAGRHTRMSPRFHNLVVRVCREWTTEPDEPSAHGPGVPAPK